MGQWPHFSVKGNKISFQNYFISYQNIAPVESATIYSHEVFKKHTVRRAAAGVVWARIVI